MYAGTNMACQIVGTITTYNFLLKYFYVRMLSDSSNKLVPNVDTILVWHNIIMYCVGYSCER